MMHFPDNMFTNPSESDQRTNEKGNVGLWGLSISFCNSEVLRHSPFKARTLIEVHIIEPPTFPENVKHRTPGEAEMKTFQCDIEMQSPYNVFNTLSVSSSTQQVGGRMKGDHEI